MANDPISSKTLTLSIIHAHWTAALDQPPTTSLAPLRRLINAIIKHGVNHGAQHGESSLLPRQHFALLWLDLCLTYAFLGDYWLAIKAADSAVVLYPTLSLGWFAKGLCKAELGEWRKARRDFKQCLICFEIVGRRLEKLPFRIHQSARIPRIGLGEEWMLEWVKVEWNYKVALIKGGSRRDPQSPSTQRQHELGLNGIPAGVHMGPGWDANLEFFGPVYFDVVPSAYSKTSPPSLSSKSSPNDNGEVFGSWKSDSTTAAYYYSKPLPPIPEASPIPLIHEPSPPTATLPTVRVFSYCPTPKELYPHTPTPSPRNSIRADSLAKETWTPLMPPRVSLESPLNSYFPKQTSKKHDSQNDVWWQGTEQIRGPLPQRRGSSISDVISEWIADSDDFDDSLDQPGPHGGYFEHDTGEAENGNGFEGESECVVKDDDDSDICKRQRENTNFPGPTDKRIGKGKEKEIAIHIATPLANRPEDVNEKGEQILLPKAFPGFPADIERRRVLA